MGQILQTPPGQLLGWLESDFVEGLKVENNLFK